MTKKKKKKVWNQVSLEWNEGICEAWNLWFHEIFINKRFTEYVLKVLENEDFYEDEVDYSKVFDFISKYLEEDE